MDALFDSGNSRLHFSLWDGKKSSNYRYFPYPVSVDSLHKLLDHHNIENIAACSVSSLWREPLFDALNTVLPGKLFVARTPDDIGIKTVYTQPSELGIDRALACYAAYQYFNDSCVVVDFGTAVTIDTVANDGTMTGGYIFPGSHSIITSLSNNTDLPRVDILHAEEGVGTNTYECIAKGVALGYHEAVNALIVSATAIIGNSSRVIISGGGAEAMMPFLTCAPVYRQNLVIDGLGLSLGKLPAYML